MKYQEWLKEWLENYVKPSVKVRTHKRYVSIVEKHIVPSLGEFELEQLTPLLLQKFIAELLQNGNCITNEGLSVNSVNGIITILKTTLKLAYSLGLSKENVGEKLKRPKTNEKAVSSFTVEEQKRIEKAVMGEKRTKMYGVIICLYTGLRIGELLALEWQKIDLYKGILTINQACYDGKDEWGVYGKVLDAPKTKSSVREIPIPKQLIAIFKELKKKAKSTFVIERKDGGNVSVRSYQRSFELLLKKLEIPRKGFHALRHTFATRALECGMDVKTLSEILGHKNPTITLNRYVHSMLEHKKNMMNKLGKILQLESVGLSVSNGYY